MADWDILKPADGDTISQYPANARARRSAVETIFDIDHHAADDADQGKHDIVTLVDAAADPTFPAGQVGIWNNAGALKTRVASAAVNTLATISDTQGVLNAPAGTRMLFQQTTAPTGWTKDATHNDKALRVVSGTVGSGGSVAFTSAFATGRTSDGHALTLAQIPSHAHGLTAHGNGTNTGSLMSSTEVSSPRGVGDTGAAGGGSAHAHGLPSFAVSYVDIILATKD